MQLTQGPGMLRQANQTITLGLDSVGNDINSQKTVN